MTPKEWLVNRSLLIQEPTWSNWFHTNDGIYIYYRLEVTNADKAKEFLKKRGFEFANDWQDKIVKFISDDIQNVDRQGWFTYKDTGFEIKGITPTDLK